MRWTALAAAALVCCVGFPAAAHPCYRRVFEPARYQRIVEEMVVSPEREIEQTITPATRTVEETYVVRPSRAAVRVVPASYGYATATVEVAPAHREWRVREEGGQTIGCWVNVPARYGETRRRVEATPAREIAEAAPGETATRRVTEIVAPARVVRRVIPAQYARRERIVMVSPGVDRWEPLPTCPRW